MTIHTPNQQRPNFSFAKTSQWANLLMRGTRDYPMHRYPFDVICCQRLDEQGQPFGSPL